MEARNPSWRLALPAATARLSASGAVGDADGSRPVARRGCGGGMARNGSRSTRLSVRALASRRRCVRTSRGWRGLVERRCGAGPPAAATGRIRSPTGSGRHIPRPERGVSAECGRCVRDRVEAHQRAVDLRWQTGSATRPVTAFVDLAHPAADDRDGGLASSTPSWRSNASARTSRPHRALPRSERRGAHPALRLRAIPTFDSSRIIERARRRRRSPANAGGGVGRAVVDDHSSSSATVWSSIERAARSSVDALL